MSKRFHEGDFFSEYKYLRNQFRKYNSHSLIDLCFRFLYKKYDDEIEEIEQKQPWQILLLIKWILKDDNFDLPNRNKATHNNLIALINLIRELGNKVRMPDDYDHWELLFRNLAYQQFFYQRRFNLNAYSRQSLLFSDLEDNHYIKSVFRNETGLEINEFIELSAFLLSNQVNRLKSFRIEYFSTLFSFYNPKLIDKYLNNLSLTFTEARQYLLDLEGDKISSYEYHEQTPFIKRPLLKFNKRYYPYYRNILYRGVEYFIYDRVREKDPEKFMQKFGSIFEDYVKYNLDYCNAVYKSEDQLKRELKHTSKVVDFLISEKGKTILLDAKGVEMSYLGKVSHRSNIVKRTVKSSIIKGIEQAYELVYNLRKNGSNIISKNYKDHYFIVVTFKELYMGNGKNFSEVIAPDFIEKLIEKYGGEQLIPLDNIYFLSIDSFEFWIEMIKQKKSTFLTGLQKAIEADSDPKTMTFDFSQHVASWDQSFDVPQFLKDEFHSIFDEGLQKIKEK